MPSWCSRALAALLVAGALAACDGDRCVRMSDCASGLECRAGTCSEPLVAADAAAAELDGAVSRGDAGAGAGDDDAGAASDAAAEPDADVIADAGADGLDASADAQSLQEDDGGGPTDLDAAADAGL